LSEVTLTAVEPTPDQVQYLEDRIYEFNSKATDITDGELLAFLVRDGDRIVAGICGNTWGGTCELRQFWVDESHRHRGRGTRLFRGGRAGGAPARLHPNRVDDVLVPGASVLRETGFEVIAALDNHPRGHRNLLMRKRLGPDLASRPGESA
jgi:GNAT superfamily N-acetyltransferase